MDKKIAGGLPRHLEVAQWATNNLIACSDGKCRGASRYMASRLMRSIAHASSAPNIALVDAMSLTWLLLMLLVMVVLELLSSRGSLACPAAGGSWGGRRRHFLPLLDSM